jgi:L-ascorbate metabolism protein UlaG (beta-lactamase superfamily)
MTTRRSFLATGAALGATALLPTALPAQDQASNTFETDEGPLTVHPVGHASFVLETPVGVIYVDPTGAPAQYEGMPDPDLILVTHEHGDHYEPETIQAIMVGKTQILSNMAVYDLMPAELQAVTQQLANGETTDMIGVEFEAIPAYNVTEGRRDYHPEGRDNGYVFEIGGKRVYVAGDTEGTEEMRALEEIFLAFVPMNLPYTMDASQAAEAVAAFQPDFVYPYHYRGEGDGMQDPEAFRQMLSKTDAETEVRIGDWYESGGM